MKAAPMVLGTVQLGMDYGIANSGGKPDNETSFAVLRTALEGGVDTLDTARAYGNSEEVIGSFLKTWKGPAPKLVTKIPKLQGSTPKELERFAVTSLEASLEQLGVNKVEKVMLHGSKDPATHGNACAHAAKALIDLGYTDRVGVSVYTAEDIAEMLPYEIFSVTQVPMSLFDQRLINDGSIEKLKEQGYDIYVRSVFLQGLFFLDPDKLTDPILLTHAAPKLRLLRDLAEKLGISIAQLAISFMQAQEGLAGLVLGAETPEQVKNNLSCFGAPLPDEETMALLRKEFAFVDIPEIMKVLSRPKK